jgi:hypothetical protein
LPVLRIMRKTERTTASTSSESTVIVPVQVGPYVLDAVLGHGAESYVYRAQHAETGAMVALKLNARGDAALFDQLLGEDWPPQLLRSIEADEWNGATWVARELADETLHDYLSHRRATLSVDLVLEVFRTCCDGVSWLHERHMSGWSAHARNVYRVGEVWRIGDFGRAWRSDAADSLRRTGLPHDSEYRLKLDDCAMLGGLLVEMLTGKRWEWFFRALNKRPYCSAVYSLTGDSARDRCLSAIVNRAWRGDAGGAPLLANGERGAQTVYADALELLTDVQAALVVRSSPK